MYAFMGRMHRNNTRLATGSTNAHVHGHAGTYNDGSHNSPPFSEQQLIPLSLLPPHRLARGGTFLCHKHAGRASAACTAAAQLGLLSNSAHATEPCLLLRFCWLLQHLPPNISTAPALCDLPISNPSNCPAFSTAFLQTLSHFFLREIP